ncbi:MAG: NAD(P)/FAD-dependent oxidoreductase [Candidatus Hydrogenedentes bacterium]|nr:NAD(P)/FAD-dependent oxidoreductase [Candidatus Hydrogenedentota bacterium]
MSVKYNTALADKSYDAILIGSGIGSLTTAAILAKAGQRVLVLERHYEPGGFMQTFRRKGYEWDVGIHYVGMVHRPHSLERRLFDYISEGRLQWADMGSPYDRAIIDGDAYDFVPDPRAQLELWQRTFPKDARAIDRYWELVRAVQPATAPYFAARTLPSLLGAPLTPLLQRRFLHYARRTTFEVLSELTDNPRLIEVLCAQCGDYGLPPQESSFAMHALVVYHYRWGGAYPCGGGRAVHRSVIRTIEERGGIVARRAPVAQILIKQGKAAGVVLENGDIIRAPRIISGAGLHTTYLRLLAPEQRILPVVEHLLRHARRSYAHVCLYVGLDASDSALSLPKHNFWIYDRPAAAGQRVADAYISFPSAKDPDWPHAHPDKATIQVITGADYKDFAHWENEKWMRRGEEYAALKQGWADSLLEYLYAHVPQARGHVAYTEVSTPVSTRHFANYDQGQIYGLEHTPERFQLHGLGPRTPITGLYLTGQDVATAGVAGAVIGGVLAASAIMKRSLLRLLRGNRALAESQ